MPKFWAYDGTGSGVGWRDIQTIWAYDGSTWRDIQEAWAYDGTAWRQVFGGCSDPSCDSAATGWGEAGCTFSRCKYCMTLEHTGCVDACVNIDSFMSTNGGSFLLVAAQSDKTCLNKTATAGCSATDFDINISNKCLAPGNSYQGQLKMQRTSDSVYTCTRQGSVKTGSCIS